MIRPRPRRSSTLYRRRTSHQAADSGLRVAKVRLPVVSRFGRLGQPSARSSGCTWTRHTVVAESPAPWQPTLSKKRALDTMRRCASAQSLYESLGFRQIAPYRAVEFGDTVFYELSLDGTAVS